jgi:hypothetical protein
LILKNSKNYKFLTPYFLIIYKLLNIYLKEINFFNCINKNSFTSQFPVERLMSYTLPMEIKSMVDKLNSNDNLAVLGSITSHNGRHILTMQGDGNLVLYRSGGKACWATGTNGRVVSQAIMQGDGNFVMYGPGGAYIWDTATDGHPGAYLIVLDDGNVVVFDPSGNPLWATNTNIVQRIVDGFLPSSSGFHFSNSFPHVPDLKINVLGQEIAIGDAHNGVCGGMVFAVRDYFEAGVAIPPDTTGPSSGYLFDFLVKRLFDSFNLLLPPPPAPIPPFKFFAPLPPFGPGPATYAWLMNPDLPDHETVASNVGLAPRGRAWIMINDEWPKIKADIDSGRLSPVALVEIKSSDLLQMGQNHQVLAYGYDLDGADLLIRVYDPNFPNDDTITMSLCIADPQHTTPVNYSKGGTVWCFFRPVYIFCRPSMNVAWESLGGTLTSAPAVSSWASGRLDVFARGTDNALWHLSYSSGWGRWEQLGANQISSNPAAISWGPNRIDVFVRGTDNALYTKSWDGNRWTDYVGLGGVLTSAPAVCSWASGRLDVFARGTDNALWHLSYNGRWGAWERLGINQILSNPAAAAWGPNRIDVFVIGTDNALYTKSWDGNQWTDYHGLGGVLTSAPAVSSWASGRLDVFARGTDNALWHLSYDGGWGTWEQLGANQILSNPAAVSWGSNRIDVLVRGTDNVLYHKWWDGQWRP